VTLTYQGENTFKCGQGYKWPLWAVNANRSQRGLTKFSLAKFDSHCSSCRCAIVQSEPYIWEHDLKRATCWSCGQ
jgi:hypothetical protein